EWVEELEQADGALRLETLLEIVALEQPRHRVARRQIEDAGERERIAPLRVELDARPLAIQDPEDLLFVGLGIGEDFLSGQALARFGPPRRVTDHAGEVAD